MKTIFAALALVVSSAQFCAADVTDKLIGTWKGTQTVKANGKTTKVAATTVIKRFQQHGLIFNTTVKIAGQPEGKGTTKYYDSGDAEGTIFQNGKTIGVFTGTWSVNKNTIFSKSQVSTIVGDYTQTATTILIDRKTMSGVSSTSKGVRVSGTLKKR